MICNAALTKCSAVFFSGTLFYKYNTSWKSKHTFSFDVSHAKYFKMYKCHDGMEQFIII